MLSAVPLFRVHKRWGEGNDMCTWLLVHWCKYVKDGDVSYNGVMWYISVRHPANTLSPAVIASFCCHSLFFALGSFDAFLIPLVTMEMQGWRFVSCTIKGRCMAGTQGDSSWNTFSVETCSNVSATARAQKQGHIISILILKEQTSPPTNKH